MTPATAESSLSAPHARPAALALGEASTRAVAALVAKHGEAQRAAAEQGVARVAARWSAADGDAAAFEALAPDTVQPEPERATACLA